MKFFGRTLKKTPISIGICFGVMLSVLVVPLLDCHQKRRGYTTQESSEDAVDDYEPIINLQRRPVKSSQETSEKNVPVFRPRYYSTELEIRDKLLIAVLTTSNTIPSLGVALNRTFPKHTAKIVYFFCSQEGENREQLSPDLKFPSLVKFSENCKASAYSAIRFITENYIAGYDFVFIMKDSTYLRAERLYNMVSRISMVEEVYMGRPNGVRSCDLDAGLLLSHRVFVRLSSRIDRCSSSRISEPEQNSVEQCIMFAAGIPCAQTVRDQTFRSVQLDDSKDFLKTPEDITGYKDFDLTFTVFPVPSENLHYALHNFFSNHDLSATLREVASIQHLVVNLTDKIANSWNYVAWPIGHEPPYTSKSRFDVLRCFYFNDSHLLWENDVEVSRAVSGVYKQDNHFLAQAAERWVHVNHGDHFAFVKIANGYRRFDPTRGMEYVIDFHFRNTRTREMVLKRLEMLRPLSKSEFVPVPYVTEHSRVVLVLFVTEKELDEATLFVEEYVKVCMEKSENAMLLLAFLYGDSRADDVFVNVKNLATAYSNKYRRSSAKIALYSIKILDRVPSDFGLMDLIARKLSPDSLVLLCQTGMEMRTEYLNRVRMNTIVNAQVFIPVPFVQFHPVLSKQNPPLAEFIEIKKETGFFDSNNFEHVSFYISDYWKQRSLISREVPIARSSADLKAAHYHELSFGIVELFLVTKQVHILRAVEPELRIHYIWRDCDLKMNLRAIETCRLSRLYAVGSKSQQAAFILSEQDKQLTSPKEIINNGS